MIRNGAVPGAALFRVRRAQAWKGSGDDGRERAASSLGAGDFAAQIAGARDAKLCEVSEMSILGDLVRPGLAQVHLLVVDSARDLIHAHAGLSRGAGRRRRPALADRAGSVPREGAGLAVIAKEKPPLLRSRASTKRRKRLCTLRPAAGFINPDPAAPA